jgi:hypothetical protein
MRRAKRDRGKPIPVGDLQQIAKFRAELSVYSKLRSEGANHVEAMRAVFTEERF